METHVLFEIWTGPEKNLKRLTVNADQRLDHPLVPVDGGQVEGRVTLETEQRRSLSPGENTDPEHWTEGKEEREEGGRKRE